MSPVRRIEIVLAEGANVLSLCGHSTWQPSDFYTAAQKFVHHLYSIAVMGPDIGVTTRAETYDDMMNLLEWDIPDQFKDNMIEACLDELYDEFMQEE